MKNSVIVGRILTSVLWIVSITISIYTFFKYPQTSSSMARNLMTVLAVSVVCSTIFSVLYLKYISPLQKSRDIIEEAIEEQT